MPLILPISGWSLFHLHLTSFSRVENENARLNSDLSSANLRWISKRSRQSLLRGLMKKNILFWIASIAPQPPPHTPPNWHVFCFRFMFFLMKNLIIAYVYNWGKIIILMIEPISCWHYYQKMTIGIFLMMKLSWNKNQHVNECY